MSRSFSTIEPLEARIAPALLVNGANLLGGSSPISGETSNGANAVTVVKMLSGQAIVWYQDGAIRGISVGPNASLEIHGDVLGDIVANLTASGRLSDSDNDPLNGEDGAVLLPNNILGIKTLPLSPEKGAVGNIITGGSVSNLNIQGAINGIYAGDGVFNAASRELKNGVVTSSLDNIDFNPIEADVQSDFVFTKSAAQIINPAKKLTGLLPGASIIGATLAKGVDLQIIAGSGNPNGLSAPVVTAGGSIRNIGIDAAFSSSSGLAANATASYELHAGDGSTGVTGGAGGQIDHVTEKSSTGKVLAYAGNGGEGLQGAGGAGGSITNYVAGSASSLYTLVAGDGGRGIPGGAGGSVVGNNFANRSAVGGLLVSANFDNTAGDDLIVINQGTGEMIVEHNNGTSSNFTPVVQHDTTTLITGFGNTPVSAFATDVNGDGKLDVVVAYKNSDSIGVFLNQGNGVFWDPGLNAGQGGYAGFTVGLTFSPAKITESSGRIVAAENTVDGKSGLHLLRPAVDQQGALTYEAEIGVNTLSRPVVDLVTLGDGSVLVGTVDGLITRITISGAPDGNPFDTSPALVQVVGGLADLDVDSTGLRVAALSSTGQSFGVFAFDPSASTGALTLISAVSGLIGTAQSIHFIHDSSATTDDQVAVLDSLSAGSRVDLYSAQTTSGATGFVLTKTVTAKEALRVFVPVYSSDAGFAGISGSLNQFTFSDNFAAGVDYALPFASKSVEAHGGHGGYGNDYQPLKNGVPFGALLTGKGGAGGSISGLNADANDLILFAGDGGDAKTNAGGAGGSINNPATAIFNANGSYIVSANLLVADNSLSLTAGQGGAPDSAGKLASGGAGGSLINLNLELVAGDLNLTAGRGGDALGGAGGAGGLISGVSSLLHDGNLTVAGGIGGHAAAVPVGGTAATAVGGAGGSITNFKHELRLEADVEKAEKAYQVSFTAGVGGTSVSSSGGAGGSVTGLTLKLDEADVATDSQGASKDSTLTTNLVAGNGGGGTKGGAGGGISTLRFNTVLDQITPEGVIVGSAVLALKGGDGGIGTAGPGGNGGSILLTSPLSGLSYLDPEATVPGPAHSVPLYVQAGNGAKGSTTGGLGGDVTGLSAQNQAFVTGEILKSTQLSGAFVAAGNGGDGGLGDGGRGGNIVSSLLGVQNNLKDQLGRPSGLRPNFIEVYAGEGGDGGVDGNTTTAKAAKGGAGGNVTTGQFGLVSTNRPIGMDIEAGAGGSGYALGGAGGTLNGLILNISQSTGGIAAILLAGNGGDAQLAAGVGGKGGDVNTVSQVKDVNSSINLVQAGNGGDNPGGKAGLGGNVLNIKTVGFIGRPSAGMNPLGVFDSYMTTINNVVTTIAIPQGIFAGRGGTGTVALPGAGNGAVTNVAARQIAAIAAAMDPATKLFAAASKVAQITADLIGFDADRGQNNAGTGIFNDKNGGTSAPNVVTPQDGFIFSLAPLTGVTGARTGFVFP